MRAARLALVAIVLVASSSNNSEGLQAKPGAAGFSSYYRFGTAEDLVNECRAVEHIDTNKKAVPVDDLNNLGLCYGFIAGAIDLDSLVSGIEKHSTSEWCVPHDASDSQLAKIIVKFGDDHPEQLHYAAIVLVSNAFIGVYRC